MKFRKLTLLFQTLLYLKPSQLYYQVFYRLRNKLTDKDYSQIAPLTEPLKIEEGISYRNSYLGEGRFRFLNLEKQFDEINWNFEDYGKLWVYNLNYFDYLNQESMSMVEGLRLVEDFVGKHSRNKEGLEPYPISLRGINWIKFFSTHQVNNKSINNCLYRDYMRLMDNLEYHLLANHLLENAFSLLFGAYFFKDERLYSKAKKLLLSELDEQILDDGAHYELSPMYHQIILHRVLDSYNLVKNNSWKNQELLPVLEQKSHVMLSWLENISFQSGDIPKLNDAADGIAPTTKQLLSYAKGLGLSWKKISLGDSGYRNFSFSDFEVIIDVGQIMPTYQPGHAHADSLQFVLNYRGEPIIVDTGISTYEKNSRRHLERSTCSHNTVTISDENSSEVWSGFRVGRRAKVSIHNESLTTIVASHNGYRKFGVTYRRSFRQKKDAFVVTDEIENPKGRSVTGHLHFHSDVRVECTKMGVIVNNELKVNFKGAKKLILTDYEWPTGFNLFAPAKKLIYYFDSRVEIEVKIIR